MYVFIRTHCDLFIAFKRSPVHSIPPKMHVLDKQILSAFIYSLACDI